MYTKWLVISADTSGLWSLLPEMCAASTAERIFASLEGAQLHILPSGMARKIPWKPQDRHSTNEELEQKIADEKLDWQVLERMKRNAHQIWLWLQNNMCKVPSIKCILLHVLLYLATQKKSTLGIWSTVQRRNTNSWDWSYINTGEHAWLLLCDIIIDESHTPIPKCYSTIP